MGPLAGINMICLLVVPRRRCLSFSNGKGRGRGASSYRLCRQRRFRPSDVRAVAASGVHRAKVVVLCDTLCRGCSQGLRFHCSAQCVAVVTTVRDTHFSKCSAPRSVRGKNRGEWFRSARPSPRRPTPKSSPAALGAV